ncbi:hypothetical protein PAENIP36_18370 [Paenibacillus sp. P36]
MNALSSFAFCVNRYESESPRPHNIHLPEEVHDTSFNNECINDAWTMYANGQIVLDIC